VGLSKPTLYHYFRSKEELLVRLYSDVLDESVAGGRAVVAAAASPLEAIRELIAARVVHTCERKALLTVLFEEEKELPADLATELILRRRAFEDLFAQALAEHLAAHPDALPGIAPKVYVNMCLGAANWTYKWYSPDGPSSPAELGRQMAHTLTASLSS
jgi:AcrR family transcriptional regulator